MEGDREGVRQTRVEQDDGPGTEGHQGGKPWVPSNGQNWENKNLTPPLAYH